MILTEKTKERFWIRVEKDGYRSPVGTCWEWTGRILPSGYASFYCLGKSRRAHRISFEIANYPPDDNMVIMHTCDNRKCVNPDHLIQATQKENVQDCLRKNRRQAERGEKRWSAKLTEAEAREIKVMFRDGVSLGDISIRFPQVKKRQIKKIADGEKWKHISIPKSSAN